MTQESSGTAALPEIQPGSIVSKRLVSAAGGQAIGFAFASGQELTAHVTPREAMMLVHEGHFRITIEEAEHELAAGECLVLPASVPHAVLATRDTRALLVMLKT